MRGSVVLSTVAIAVMACGGAARTPERLGARAEPIVNGQDDAGDPATVYIDLGGGSCTGTLISPLIVLTAQHCTEGVDSASMNVLFGSDASNPTDTIQVANHQDNPNGQPGGPGDLSLLVLASPGKPKPIPVNKQDVSKMIGAEVRIAGFGVTSENGDDAGIKRQGKTSITHVDQGLIYTAEQPSSTCYGDSGGPNFVTIGGIEYVAAATSFGTGACGQGEDGAARTDDSIQWIEQYGAMNDPNWSGASASSATASSSASSGAGGGSASASASSAEASSASSSGSATSGAGAAPPVGPTSGAGASDNGGNVPPGNQDEAGDVHKAGSCALEPAGGGPAWEWLALAAACVAGTRQRVGSRRARLSAPGRSRARGSRRRADRA